MRFNKMILEEIAEFIDSASTEDMKCCSMELTDRLGTFVWEIGRLWDKVEGTDPTHGPQCKYGTRNRRSITYKLRKVARFSYP